MSYPLFQAARTSSGLGASRALRGGSAAALPAREGPAAGTLARAWATRAHALDELPSDRMFVEMLAAYRPSGGLARLDTLARMPAVRGDSAHPNALELIVAGAAFSFEWRQVFWVPMFQFTPPGLVPKAEVRQVLAELAGIFDGWSLATWFSLPNCWLKSDRPVDLLDSQLALVLAAARVDRFIASG